MSQPPYGPPGSTGDGEPQYNPNTGLPESQPGPPTQQYGSDPYSGGQYGGGQYGGEQYDSQPAPSYGGDQQGAQYGSQPGQYGGDQYGAPADPYGQQGQYGTGQQGQYGTEQYSSDQYSGGQYGSQPGQYGGDQYSSDQYAASAAASPYGDGQYLNPIGGTAQAQGESDKSFIVTWLLGWLLGSLGADRFYLGKIGTAIAKLLTAGGLGIWALIDLIMHLVGATRDKEGRRLAGYDQHKKKAWIITIGVWLIQLVIGIIVTVVLVISGGISLSGGVSTGPGTDPTQSSPSQPGDDQGGDDTDDTGDQSGDSGDQQASGAAADWAESTYGSFDPVTVDGSGDEVVPVPDGVDAALVTLEPTSDYARASSVDADGQMSGGMYISGEAGESAQSTIGIDDYGDTAGIEVSGGGDWAVTFAPISSAPALPESGSGSGIYLYEGDGGPITLDYTGDSNFIVLQMGDNGTDLLANEIDSWSGDAEMVPGPSVVSVQSSGDWTITPG